jgi:hypothetical protein
MWAMTAWRIPASVPPRSLAMAEARQVFADLLSMVHICFSIFGIAYVTTALAHSAALHRLFGQFPARGAAELPCLRHWRRMNR